MLCTNDQLLTSDKGTFVPRALSNSMPEMRGMLSIGASSG
jgi:hypothetical protein